MGDDFRLLVVDADEAFLETTASVLPEVDERFTVDGVTAPDCALARLAEEGFDGLLVSYDLPDVGGIELCERVRADRPDLPRLLATDTHWDGEVAAAMAAGVTDFVRKPSGTAQYRILANRVGNAIEHARTQRDHPEERMLLDQLFEQVPIHLYIKDEQARHVYVSDFYVEGRTDWIVDSVADLIGQTDRDVDPDAGAETYAEDLQVIETGEPILDKEEYVPHSGDWLLTSKVPWYDENDEIAGVIGVTRNITERKERERELQRQNERLDQFASRLSHELRNPLSVLGERVTLARQTGDPEHFEHMERSIHRMDRLIDDVLVLAREGGVEIERDPVNIAQVARSCWKGIRSPRTDLVVETDRHIVADADRLHQLLANLFRNAIEHGSACIENAGSNVIPTDDQNARASDMTVTVGELPEGFYVEDDGRGISPELHQAVLEPGISEMEHGAGLGLVVVAKIVDTHGWTIRVTDGSAGGARFEITGVEFADSISGSFRTGGDGGSV